MAFSAKDRITATDQKNTCNQNTEHPTFLASVVLLDDCFEWSEGAVFPFEIGNIPAVPLFEQCSLMQQNQPVFGSNQRLEGRPVDVVGGNPRSSESYTTVSGQR